MIVGKEKLTKYLDNGLLQGHDLSFVGGAGYDLRLGRIYRLTSESFLGETERKTPNIEEIGGKKHTLKPGDYVLVETVEKVNMPANLAARVLNRSTIFRCGATLVNALVDPGYRGTLTFGLKNLSQQDFTVEKGARIAQIVFEEVTGETTQYNGRYQGGKIV